MIIECGENVLIKGIRGCDDRVWGKCVDKGY